jgi:hypothetical protein
MKTSEVFNLVKENLAGPGQNAGYSPFICLTLTRLGIARRINVADSNRCKDIVRTLLNKSHTLEHWLITNEHVKLKTVAYCRSPRTDQKLYNTRQAWLDWLIKEYQSKGD